MIGVITSAMIACGAVLCAMSIGQFMRPANRGEPADLGDCNEKMARMGIAFMLAGALLEVTSWMISGP